MVKHKKIIQYLLIALLASTVYLQNLWFDYATLDDNLIVFEDFEKINSISKIPSAFTSGYLFDTYYRPVIMISFIIDTAIAGQSSTMYHLTNLLIHFVVSILVFLLLKKITLEELLSLLFALLFSVHPLNINAVSWIAGRNDLLITLFALLSILSFINYWESEKRIFLYLSALCYGLAMFSKEIGLMLPAIMFFYILLFRPSPHSLQQYSKLQKKKLILSLITFVIPFLVYILFRFFFSHFVVRQDSNFVLLRNLNIPLEYIAKVFYFLEFSPLSMFNITLTVLGVIISVAILAIFIFNKNIDRRKFFFGLFFFLLFVLPPVFVYITSTDGEFNYIDCRMYLPLIGFFIMLVAIVQGYSSEKGHAGFLKSRISAAVIVIVFLYALTFSIIENQYYKNGEVFWSRLTEVYPERATYWIGLGYYYFDNKNVQKAAECVEKAINLTPHIDEFYQKGALAYTNAQDYQNAIRLLERGLSLEESDKNYKLSRNKPHIYLDLIKNYLAVGNAAEAEVYSKKLMNNLNSTLNSNNDLQNQNTDAWGKAKLIYTTAYYFYSYNHYDQSLNLLDKAIKLNSSDADFHNLQGVVLLKKGMNGDAKNCFLKALEIDPSNDAATRNLQFVKKMLN